MFSHGVESGRQMIFRCNLHSGRPGVSNLFSEDKAASVLSRIGPLSVDLAARVDRGYHCCFGLAVMARDQELANPNESQALLKIRNCAFYLGAMRGDA